MKTERDTYFVQLLLKEFPRGLRGKDVAQFLALDADDVDVLLRPMLAEQVVEYNRSNGYWRLLRHSLVSDRRWKKEEKENLSQAELCLLLIAESERFEACQRLYEYLQKLLAGSSFLGVSVCFELIIYQLLSCPYEKLDDSGLRKYLELILGVQSDAFSLGVRLSLAQSLSSVASSAAEILGDQRTQALINIMDGCLRQHSGKEEPGALNKLLDDGLSAIRTLGDADIEKQIKYFLSFLYYGKGDFRACYEAFDSAQSHDQIMVCQYFNTLYPIYLAPAANRIGQYAQSIGICTGALREAQRNKDKYKELWLTAILALQFLQIGANEQGIRFLSDILDCVDSEACPKLYLWVWRGLALYHANIGNLEISHRIMTECMKMRMERGLGRFAYTSVWILEMLESYEKRGLSPVPGYELDEEADRVLTWQNRHLHGMAFKVKARRQPKEDLESRINLLRCSYDAFMECGNRREAARSALLIAQHYLKIGKEAEARELRKTARADLMDTTLRPASTLPQLAPWQGSVYSTAVRSSLERCYAAIDKIELNISAEGYAGELLNALQRELGAEYAAFCRLRQEKDCEVLAVCNASEMEFSQWHALECMRGLNRQDGPEWVLVPSGDKVFLCLRIVLPGEEPLFLFLESCYIAGAYVCLESEDIRSLLSVLKRELTSLFRLQNRQKQVHKMPVVDFVTPDSDRIEYDDSPGYKHILEQARHAAQSDAPILILGETGVGKEVLARQIHQFSGRPGMFVPVHPASTPENLFESEFFGYEKGAFTGAHKQKVGFFELADNGTFFIDELAEIPMSFQVKLLRVLQEHSFNRVGGIRYIKSNFRLVAATNKNLWNEVQEGRFREDLYYRVSVIPIKLPPLRKRQQDIPRLIRLFLQQFCTRYGRPVPPLTDELIRQCCAYSWPGNIRELRNLVERAVILNTGGPLKLFLPEYGEMASSEESQKDYSQLYSDLPTLEELSVRYMRYVLEKTQGRVIGPDGADKILGVKRSTLYAKLRKYGLK